MGSRCQTTSPFGLGNFFFYAKKTAFYSFMAPNYRRRIDSGSIDDLFDSFLHTTAQVNFLLADFQKNMSVEKHPRKVE
jgi:hypothetical protein